jgi:hypothetical protein
MVASWQGRVARLVCLLTRPRTKSLLALAGMLLVTALPRLTALNVFVVVDEQDRWNWATAFFQALVRGDLAGTLVGDGYPGIFPVWLESLWLGVQAAARSLQRGALLDEAGIWLLIHEWSRRSFIAERRFPIALANLLLVAAIYLLARRLFGERMALLGGLLVALDPFYLTDSRVNRADALTSGLMVLSILSLALYLRERRRRYLVLSSMVGGLAFLTKTQALFLAPIVLLVSGGYLFALWSAGSRRRLFLSWVTLGAAWGGVALLTYCILWPAIWVAPRETFSLVMNYATRKAGAEGINAFFLGQVLQNEDAGPLFYPLIFLLRTTPLVLLGLLGMLWGGIRGWQRLRRGWDNDRPTFPITRAAPGWEAVLVLLAYVLLYGLIMTFGSHKQDRYLMPIFPAVDLLAALGLAYVGQRLYLWWQTRRGVPFRRQGIPTPAGGRWALAGGLLVLLVQGATALPYHPYYYPYFNPLLGDGPVAVKLVRVGWGEGLDEAARYLNAKPGAEQLKAASRFPGTFRDFFHGKVLPLDAGGEWLHADYVIFYVQQVQRMQDPSPGVIRYFQQHRQPEYVVHLGGIEYAWVYPAPVARPADPGRSLIVGKAALFGYNWENGGGETLPLRLYWEQQGLSPGESLAVRLVDGAGDAGPWSDCQSLPGFEEAALKPGEVVESLCELAGGKGLSSGLYDLEVGIRSENTGALLGRFDFPEGLRAVSVGASGQLAPVLPQAAQAALAPQAVPPGARLVGLTYALPSGGADAARARLLACQITPGVLQPGGALTVTLYWQALAPMERDYYVFLHLFGRSEAPIGQLDVPPAAGSQPTSRWRPGEMVVDTHLLPVDPGAVAPTVARLDVGLYDPQTQRPLVVLDPQGRPAPAAAGYIKLIPETWPQVRGQRSGVRFGEVATLLGYELSSDALRPGIPVTVTLYWQAEAPMSEDYTVFIHLLGPDGKLHGQGDGPPVGGDYPTSWWEPGEVVADVHTLTPEGALQAGIYHLKVGLYRLEDGRRLMAADGKDAADLGTVQVSGTQ